MSKSDNVLEMEVERERLERLANLVLADCPDELAIYEDTDYRHAGLYSWPGVSRCFAETKEDEANRWCSCRDVLILVQWIAEGKYRNRPSSVERSMPFKIYRKNLLSSENVKESNHLPAQLRVSTRGPSDRPGDSSSLVVKVEQKLVGETEWKTDKELGLHKALRLLEKRVYQMEATDVLETDRVFRRLY